MPWRPAAACCCLSSLNPSVGDQNQTRCHKDGWIGWKRKRNDSINLADALRVVTMHQLHHNSTTLNSTIMSSSSSSSSDKDSNDLTDPRFLVITSIFFLYGVFIILVLFLSRGTSFWSGLWSCLKDLVGRRFGVASDGEGGGGERDAAYSR